MNREATEPDAESDLERHVEHGEGIHVLRATEDQRAWNGIRYKIGLSAKNVEARERKLDAARERRRQRRAEERQSTRMAG